MSLRLPLSLLLCALLLAALAVPASAATVEAQPTGPDRSGFSGWEMRYVAASGERNDLTLVTVDDRTLRVIDRGATIQAGARCRSLDAHTAECTIAGEPYQATRSPFLYIAPLALGDGDDVARSAGADGPLLHADGGPGADLLEGSEQKGDRLDGGGGRDRLFGRGNADILTDGDATGAADADLLDGGADTDSVSYASRTAAVRLDLADPGAAQGEPGEGDMVRSVASATGGAGDDDIDGTSTANLLHGGAGDDHLDGHGGQDSLRGDAGADRLHGHAGGDSLDGGTGADRLRGDDGVDVVLAPTRTDRISCGAARDVISNAGDAVRVGRACEGLQYAFGPDGERTTDEGTSVALIAHPVAASRRSLTFTVGCPRPAELDGLCAFTTRQTLRLRDASGRYLGRGHLDRRRYRREAARERGRQNPIRVRLTRAGRRLAARRGGVLARVSLDTAGTDRVSWTTRVTTR